jgi:adsorption protein B
MFSVSILRPEALSSVSRNTLLSNLMFLNLVLFGLRLLQRWRFTTVLYGFQHGVLTIPRLALGSVINGMAAIRAIRQFGDASRDNKQDKIIWDKTEHFFPTEETIDERRNLQ